MGISGGRREAAARPRDAAELPEMASVRPRKAAPAATEAQIKAQARYDKANTRQVHLKLNRRTDRDVPERPDSVPSKQGHIT